MIYAIAVHITYIKTLDFNWQTSTLIQPKERSAGIINIEGRAKNDDLSEVHFWDRKKIKQTNKWFAVHYNYFLGRSIHFSVSCNRWIFVDVIVDIFSDKHTTNLIEAMAVYTNKIQKFKETD